MTTWTTASRPTPSTWNITRLGGSYLTDVDGNYLTDVDGNRFIIIVEGGTLPFSSWDTDRILVGNLYDFYIVDSVGDRVVDSVGDTLISLGVYEGSQWNTRTIP